MPKPTTYPHSQARYDADVKRAEDYLGRNAAKLISPERIDWLRSVLRGEG